MLSPFTNTYRLRRTDIIEKGQEERFTISERMERDEGRQTRDHTAEGVRPRRRGVPDQALVPQSAAELAAPAMSSAAPAVGPMRAVAAPPHPQPTPP
jgi:hypothetical protein